MNIAGVVLAGGQSSRYGQPKMFEQFAGQPLYQYSLNALQQNQLQPLIIATNAHLQQGFAQDNVQWLIEPQPHQGPLFALHNIMENFPAVEWFFVLASDMPFIDAALVKALLSFIDERYDAIVPQQADRLQPLVALYRRTAYPFASKLVQQNRRSMQALLEKLRVCYVPFESDTMTFTNINTPQDWQRSQTMNNFTHWNEQGRPKMVDISTKDVTQRTAIARSTITLSDELYQAIQQGHIKKGDPTQVAQIAGIMAAKKTSDIIPMCHPIMLQGTDFQFTYQQGTSGYELHIEATVKCNGKTGVEMEALTAVSVAALTFYDMCKAVDKSMVIQETYLVQKTGGKSGTYMRD